MSSAVETRTFIEFKDLEKSFTTRGGTVTAIESLSLSVQEGEFLAVVGPSGCGKSTLLMALAGLTTPTSGEVVVGGERVDGPMTQAGVVFQSAELLSWRTALENVLLQAEVRKLDLPENRPRAQQLLEDVGLRGFENHYPDELSGGMQQRVALCRALLHDPSMILMDEPLGALDAITRDQVQGDLQNLWMKSRCTVLLITHSIEEAVFLADRVIVLSPRPATIAADITIDLPRPRHVADRGTPEFTNLVNEIRHEFSRLGVFEQDE
ncbi:ABC transporter ATP-binding protein [Aeromicrobium sp. CTD01-1L150]|uniref:ABC transporter ATP-binding protein n=1 Tax=Aeromicrobium sp. CTD01-1L150 TaxID=3341830 RepID=UPI0035C09D90